jgi:hypothetical protein
MPHILRVLAFASAVSAAAGATSWCPSALAAGSGDLLTAEEVERWAVDSPLFVRFAAVLREHEIDQFALGASSEESLVTIGIPLGVAVKLKFCVNELRDDQEAAASASAQLINGTAQAQLDAPKYGATQQVRLLGEVMEQEPQCSIGSVFSHLMSIKGDADCRAGCSGGSGLCPDDWYPSSADECSAECGAVFEPFWDRCGDLLTSAGMVRRAPDSPIAHTLTDAPDMLTRHGASSACLSSRTHANRCA